MSINYLASFLILSLPNFNKSHQGKEKRWDMDINVNFVMQIRRHK